jgi:hypothetical protein
MVFALGSAIAIVGGTSLFLPDERSMPHVSPEQLIRQFHENGLKLLLHDAANVRDLVTLRDPARAARIDFAGLTVDPTSYVAADYRYNDPSGACSARLGKEDATRFRPLLDKDAVVQHKGAIRLAGQREGVRDQDRRPPRWDLRQTSLQPASADTVQEISRLGSQGRFIAPVQRRNGRVGVRSMSPRSQMVLLRHANVSSGSYDLTRAH